MMIMENSAEPAVRASAWFPKPWGSVPSADSLEHYTDAERLALEIFRAFQVDDFQGCVLSEVGEASAVALSFCQKRRRALNPPIPIHYI